MSAYRCMAPARSCRYCCSGPLVSLSSIAILMLSGIGAWLSLSYLAKFACSKGLLKFVLVELWFQKLCKVPDAACTKWY